MKSKEEILTGGSRIVSNSGLWKGKRVMESMEEYAKQQSVEFGKWLLDEFEPGVFDEDENQNLYEPISREAYLKNSYKMEELYEIWKYDTPQN